MRAVEATPWLVPALLTVPVLVVVVAAVSWWSARGHSSFSAARVFVSGQAFESSPGSAELHFRVLSVSVQRERQVPKRGCIAVEGIEPGPSVSCTNDAGVATFNLRAPWPLPADRVVRFVNPTDSTLLAEGRIEELAAAPAAVERRGGEIRGRREGALEITLGLVQGVLAVPFGGRVRLDVKHAGEPLAAELQLSASGALPGEQTIASDALGRASVDLSPSDHVVELNVVARADSERFGPLEGRWEGLLPVVPGASFAVIEGTQLVVSSPVARDVAYVDLVRAGQVVHSLDLPLQVSDQSQGISRARWPLGTLGSHELFAVVSSEPDFRSMALVGWPLSNDGEVNATWDLRSRLVFDGVAQNRASSTRRSRNSALFGFGCVAVGALVEAGLFWMLWRKVTAEMRAIDALPYQMQRLWVWGLVTCLIVALLGLGLLQF